jgi:8-oxo-dGTP diphosphatase
MIQSPRRDWEFPGGQVEVGETLTQALKREVIEETGIVVEPKALIGIYSNIRKPSILMLDFVCDYISGEPTVSAESLNVEWVNRDTALDRVKRPAIRGRLQKMLEFVGNVTYRAYFVDPNQVDVPYTELEEMQV